jgi:hypothetical protein
MTYEESKLQLTGGAWHEIDHEIYRIQTAMNHENPIYAAKHIISQLHTKLLVAESSVTSGKRSGGRKSATGASTRHSAQFQGPKWA